MFTVKQFNWSPDTTGYHQHFMARYNILSTITGASVHRLQISLGIQLFQTNIL